MTDVKIKSASARLPKKLREAAPDFLSMALWCVLSFAAANALLFGSLAPFGPAAVAASRRRDSVAAAFGAIMGYALSKSPENNMRYIAAVLIVFGAKLVFERFASGDLVSVLIAAGGTAFASFGYAAVTIISGYGSALAFAETVLAAGAAYFFKRTSTAIEHRKPVMALSGGDRACVLMTAAIVSASLTSMTFGRLSLGGIIACAVVLFAARYGKESGGAVAGIATGTAIAITSPSAIGEILSGYALGGLICGIFAPFGKIVCAIAFAAVKLITCLVAAGEYPDFAWFYESVLAAAVFLLVPEKAGKFISSVALWDENAADSATVRDLVLSKMGQAAAGLNDIAAATRKVSESVEKTNFTDMNSVLNSVADKNCRLCSKSGSCWQKYYSETVNAFSEMGLSARKSREPVLDREFTERCQRSGELVSAVKQKYRDAARKNSEERKLKNVRSVVTDQFDGMAVLLKDIAADAASVKNTDKKLSMAVKNIFEGRNIPLFASTCYYTTSGCLNVEVSGAKERLKNADIKTITEELSDVCGCDLALPCKRDTENARRLVFCEKPLIEAEFGEASINAEGEKFCGDSSEHFIDQYSCAHMILSDGMGSGDHAALDSMMTAGLVARMVRAGFRFGSAIKLVNSALLLKSEDESLATVDALSVNLYTGRADFYKAGAAPSYVLRKGHASKLESISLPAGILGGAEYEQNCMVLGAGDIAVLVTDGVTASGEDWVQSELRCLAEKSAGEIASSLAETAFKRRTDGHSDDITVMVMKLSSCE